MVVVVVPVVVVLVVVVVVEEIEAEVEAVAGVAVLVLPFQSITIQTAQRMSTLIDSDSGVCDPAQVKDMRRAA